MSNGKLVDEALKNTPAHCRGRLADFLDRMDFLRKGIEAVEAEVSQCFIRGSLVCDCIGEAEEKIDHLYTQLRIRS